MDNVALSDLILLPLWLVVTITLFVLFNSIFEVTYIGCKSVITTLFFCAFIGIIITALVAYFFIQYWIWITIGVIVIGVLILIFKRR